MYQLSIFSAEPLSVAFEDVFLLDSSVSQTASLYRCQGIPICSMYGIFTYVWVIFGANVGKYSIHGAYGISWPCLAILRQAFNRFFCPGVSDLSRTAIRKPWDCRTLSTSW